LTTREAYQTLGLSEQGAPWDDVQAQFRALILKHHPDRATLLGVTAGSEDDALRVIQAYRLLERENTTTMRRTDGALALPPVSAGRYSQAQMLPIKDVNQLILKAKGRTSRGDSVLAKNVRWAVASVMCVLLITMVHD
jgi:hypothetical protein